MFTPRNSVPLNWYPLWKYVLIVVLIFLACLYALPNIFGESPAVQVSPKGGQTVSSSMVSNVQQILNSSNISYRNLSSSTYDIEMMFNNTDQQMQAQDALKSALGDNYIVAINLAPNTPKWLMNLGAYPMKLGLDLRGGMYFLLDVDMQVVIDNKLQNTSDQLAQDLRTQDIRYTGINLIPNQGIQIQFRDPAVMSTAQSYIASHYSMLAVSKYPGQPLNLLLNFNQAALTQIQDYAVQQTVEVMRNRVNDLGVAEASVAREGPDRVVVELPGVQDAARAKSIIGGTATLKVMLVDEQANSQAAVKGNVPIGDGLYYDANNNPVVLKNQVVLTGNSISGASVGYDPQTSLPVVQVSLSGPEVNNFSQVTGDNIGHLLAIVLVTNSFNKQMLNGKEVTNTQTNQTVVNVATIQSRLGNNFQITGIGNSRAAQDLALTIRAGALPAPVQIVEEKQIGPSLGVQNIQMGSISVVVAMALVMLFVAFYYRVFGLIADLALILNLIFIVAVMSLMPGATLSLPGIAGIVLNVGMAIDANVLIFERIREELRGGTPVQAAIHAGYERAFSTIVDANVTTFIVAVILFAIGTGPVKGFAVTLMIGIITSMFTAIMITRGIVNLIYGKRSVKRLSIGI
ncbi:MAG: preprotein translocase subunit SecD [Gammaproteobacteria bacterium]|jgi:preprotein translocase subunit SecD|nr:preprotein translocase subunit SecD [Gammaproteobacteria bacterium]